MNRAPCPNSITCPSCPGRRGGQHSGPQRDKGVEVAKTKLTDKTQAALVEAITKGLRAKVDICGFAGITTGTLNNWERAADAGDPGAVTLFEAIETALAARKVTYLRRMQRAGRDDWKMWREMLALVDPENYGKAALSVEVSGKLQTEDTTLDDEGRAARIAELLDAARARRDRLAIAGEYGALALMDDSMGDTAAGDRGPAYQGGDA